MDPDAVDDLCSPGSPRSGDGTPGPPQSDLAGTGRLPRGGPDDPWTLDFSTIVNTDVPDGVARVYEASLAGMRSYPDDDYCQYRAAVAEWVGCEAPQVVPTAGGVGAIRLALGTTVTPGDRVLVPTPTFRGYSREVLLQGGDPVFVSTDALLETDPEEYALIIAMTPNLTGDTPQPDELRAFARRTRSAGTTLLVDETLRGFSELDSLAVTDGVVVASSLSEQFGLPGMRIGFAAADGRIRDRLDAARRAWTLSSVAAAVGTHCLDRAEEFLSASRDRIRSERTRMRTRLEDRFDVLAPEAPFLVLDLGTAEAVDDVLRTLKEADIAVRDGRACHDLDTHVRVTVRTAEQNDRLFDALEV